MANFSNELVNKTRWLIINKIDLIPKENQEFAQEDLLKELNWQGPVFEISAATGEGTEKLGKAIMLELDKNLQDD